MAYTPLDLAERVIRMQDETIARLTDELAALRAEHDSPAQKLLRFDVNRLIGLDKIPAIKLVREVTGSGLKEAKDAVDAWQAQGRYVAPVSVPWSVARVDRLAHPERDLPL